MVYINGANSAFLLWSVKPKRFFCQRIRKNWELQVKQLIQVPEVRENAGSQVAVDLSKEFDGVGERRFSGGEAKYWKPTKSSIIFDT